MAFLNTYRGSLWLAFNALLSNYSVYPAAQAMASQAERKLHIQAFFISSLPSQ